MVKLKMSALRDIAKTLVGIGNAKTKANFNRKFRSCFGASVLVLTIAWNTLEVQKLLPAEGHPKHLLWMCAFLKTYSSENVYAAWFKVSEKTFRKWVWLFLEAVAKIELVSSNIWLFSRIKFLLVFSMYFYYDIN